MKLFNKFEIHTLLEECDLIDKNKSDFLFFDLNDEPIAWSIGSHVLDANLLPMMYIDGHYLLSWDKKKRIGHIEGNLVLDSEGETLYTFIKA